MSRHRESQGFIWFQHWLSTTKMENNVHMPKTHLWWRELAMIEEPHSLKSNSYIGNLRIVQAAECNGVRFCPSCGTKMRDCCDLHRQFNLLGHRPNGIHQAPKEWICLNCGLREYKDLAMRIACGDAGHIE
jgi:hypothetical protein